MTTEEDPRVVLDHEFYLPECLAAAASDYAPCCTIQQVEFSPQQTTITITVLPDFAAEASTIVSEFLNYLLDLSLKQHLQRW